jgi:lipopolysaccharide/colanic/teichoic acid biosynthesis glycosyltransferase
MRARYKTGLTGWAQVNYSYGASIDDSLIKLQYDPVLHQTQKLLFDLNIALKPLQRYCFTEDSNVTMAGQYQLKFQESIVLKQLI